MSYEKVREKLLRHTCMPVGRRYFFVLQIAPFVFKGITVGVENAEKQAVSMTLYTGILCLPCDGPPGVFDKKPSQWFNKTWYNSSNYQP